MDIYSWQKLTAEEKLCSHSLRGGLRVIAKIRTVPTFIRTVPILLINTLHIIFVLVNLLAWTVSNCYSYSDAIVVYNRIENSPVMRLWDDLGKTWQEENLGLAITGSENIPRVVKVYSAPANGPRPNEKIVIALNNDGRLVAMVWDGSSFPSSKIVTLTTNLSGQVSYIPFDGAYELTNSTFIVVYSGGGTGDGSQCLWASWDGTNWTTNRTFPAEPGSVAYRWVRVEAQPKVGSNRIVAVVAEALDAGELYAIWWNGSSWGSWTNLTNGTILPNAVEGGNSGRAWDVAFASSTGRCYVFLAENDVIDRCYSDDGGAWTAVTNNTVTLDVGGGTFRWCFAAADRSAGSNRIIVATLDSANDIAFAALINDTWGSQAGGHQVPDTSLETSAQSNTLPVLGVAFESDSGDGLLVYAESGLNAPRYRVWTPSGGLGQEQTMPTNLGGLTINSLQLFGDRNTNDIWFAGENNRGRLMFVRWNGTSWGTASLVTPRISMNAQRACYGMSQGAIAYGRNDHQVPYRTLGVH
ncbi:MAG: hypothetical protein SNJ64_02845 [Endomicrobiia bacterium]